MELRVTGKSLFRCGLWVCVIALSFGALAYLGIQLTRGAGRIAAVWVPNAILLIGLMRARPQAVPILFAACFAANLAANFLIGDPAPVALSLAGVNAIEVFIVWHLLGRFGFPRPGFIEFDEIRAFGLSALVATALSSSLAVGAMVWLKGAEPVELLWKWFRSDLMGLIIVVPAVTILANAWQSRQKLTRKMVIDGAIVIGFGSAISAYTFYQTRFPLLFLDAPLVLLYAYRLGAVGNAIAILNLAIVASIATTVGHGPISLVRGDLGDKLFVLQIFLASSFAMGLPVAALLKAKHRAETRYRQIAQLSPVGIFQTDAYHNLLFGNAAFRDKIGTEEEMYGSPVWDAIGSLGGMGPCEFTALDERTGRTLKVRTQTLEDAAGEPDGVLGALIDMSPEVLAQMKLEEAKRSFETLTELSPAGISRASADGHYTYVNRAWQKLSGIEEFCAMGVGWMAAIHPEDRHRVSDAWFDAVEAGGPLEIEYRFLKADGAVSWIKALARPEIGNDGSVAGFIGVALDITDRMEIEAELIKAKRGADEAALSKAQFLANMSHEIRTPMNGVLGFAQMLSREELTERQQRHVQMIVQSGTTMLGLLNDILDISKMEAGRMELHFEAMDVRHQLAICVEGLRSLADGKGIGLNRSVSSKVPDRIECDPLRFRQILSNIIGNAIKFTDEGHVSISISSEDDASGDRLLVRVSDTGIGIAPDKLEAIFGYFDQAEATVTTRFGGTGLGLAITKNLIEKFGGSVEVQSSLGCGSTFFIRLPYECPLPEHGEATLPDRCGQSPANRQITSLEILVAEDNEINSMLLASMLERLGLEATFARDGAEAVEIVEKARAVGLAFDLVLMDIRMPVMDGLEATRNLRARGFSSRELPIVALTANSFPEDIQACLKAGMQEHLAKPLEFDRLVDLLSRHGSKPDDSGNKAAGMADGLRRKFDAQRERVFASLQSVLQSRGNDVPDDLAMDLHQLAGTAAYFDQADFGTTCRDAEHAVRTLGGPELHREIERLFAVHLDAG